MEPTFRVASIYISKKSWVLFQPRKLKNGQASAKKVRSVVQFLLEHVSVSRSVKLLRTRCPSKWNGNKDSRFFLSQKILLLTACQHMVFSCFWIFLSLLFLSIVSATQKQRCILTFNSLSYFRLFIYKSYSAIRMAFMTLPITIYNFLLTVWVAASDRVAVDSWTNWTLE